ncbi:MAG: hypothetical protein NC118_03515 [Eubacterium sp.]|nr:hypothetical protein [Eubacterium sp.]
MIEEKRFDYENYIQNRLKEIDSLDERRFAKELLLEGIGNVFAWAERKYEALEQRMQNELDVPWNYFNVYMTIIDKADYDPINPFWFPVCEADIKKSARQEYETVYLAAGEEMCREFREQKTLTGIGQKSGQEVLFRIERSTRYLDSIKKLYELFANNHIPWQTLHLGYMERFFDLIPEKETGEGETYVIQYGKWDAYIKKEKILLWNIQETSIHSNEFRIPCIDEVLYEHIFYLPEEGTAEDGNLVETGDDILSIRYEKNKIILKTAKAALGDTFLYKLHQGSPEMSVGYQFPVLSNCGKDTLSGRYLQQTGSFLQTPMELNRKIEEMSGGYKIDILGCEIVSHAEGKLIDGDMNGFMGAQVFDRDERKILLLRIKREAQYAADYLYESQLRYILSQMQMEFMEYKCVGVLV